MASARWRAASTISRSTSAISEIFELPVREGTSPRPSARAEAESDAIPPAMRPPNTEASTPASNRNTHPPPMIAHREVRPGASTMATGTPSPTVHPDRLDRLWATYTAMPSMVTPRAQLSSD